jgi:hypothetical protein
MKTKTISLVLISGVLLAVALYAGALIYLTWPISSISIDKSGVFGDSFGLLTSLFSGLASAGLIITILMQKEELSLQREDIKLARSELSGQRAELKAQNETLKIQRFENTFFKMLEILDSCRKDIFYQTRHFQRQNTSYEGREAIRQLYEKLSQRYFFNYVQENLSAKYVFADKCNNKEGINERYIKFYTEHGDDLGQYFRTLYNIIKLIDRNFSSDEGLIYSNLLRAQLSRYELLLIFYNCLSSYGEKLTPLIKKYLILKHLESELIIEQHRWLLNEWSGEPN